MIRRYSTSLPWQLRVLLVAGVLGVACALAVNGVVSSACAEPRVTPATDTSRPRDGGPVIDGTRQAARSHHVPAKTVVLTFDGGPDPVWTPRILEVLSKHQVPGTFFVTGSLASRYPDVVGAIHTSGSELGLRTFSCNSTRLSGQRMRLELAQTQLAVAGGAGVTTSIVRLPHPPAVRQVGRAGYATVLATVDSQDSRQPGVDAIVRNATPTNGEGEIVQLHDGGGDRTQTVAALDRLIPELRRLGYSFATVGEVVGTAVNVTASTAQHTRGVMLATAVRVASVTTNVLAGLLAAVGLLLVLRLLLVLVVARRQARRCARRHRGQTPPVEETVSVIVLARGTGRVADTVRSVVASDCPVEVLVVDDGTSEGAVDTDESLALPAVRVIRTAIAGRAAALNAGIAHAESQLVVITDAGVVFEPHTVSRLVQPFVDPTVGAVAGNARVVEGWDLAGTYQRLEDVVGEGVERRMYDVLRCMPTVPGTVGGFRRQTLLQAGGVSDDTLAADTDLTMSVSRAGWVVMYEDAAYAWLEAPVGFGELWRRRQRRSYGILQAMWKHRRAMVERGASGRFGRRGLLAMTLFQVLLPMLSPLVDLFLLYGIVFLDPWRTVLVYLGLLLVQACTAGYALRLDREPVWMLLLIPLQQLVSRQLSCLATVRALVKAVGGTSPDPVVPQPTFTAQRADG